MNNFMHLTIEDIIANPKKYGAPTFEEFKKNPEKFRRSKEALITSADGGTKNIKGIKRHTYKVDGIKCESPEHCQRTMIERGLTEKDLNLTVELEDMKNGEIVAHVHFKRKTNLILPEGM